MACARNMRPLIRDAMSSGDVWPAENYLNMPNIITGYPWPSSAKDLSFQDLSRAKRNKCGGRFNKRSARFPVSRDTMRTRKTGLRTTTLRQNAGSTSVPVTRGRTNDRPHHERSNHERHITKRSNHECPVTINIRKAAQPYVRTTLFRKRSPGRSQSYAAPQRSVVMPAIFK